MSEWRDIQLRDIVEIKNGFAFKSKDFVEDGIPVIKIKNVKPNNIVLDTLSYVSEDVAIGKDQYFIQPQDILITMSGNRADGSPDSWVGKVALFKSVGSYLLNQRVSIIRADQKQADQIFLAYYLASWSSQLYFINNANSSGGQANISPDIVKDLELSLPPLPEQKAIAEVLSSLDDKIDLLHQQNQTLEQLAETLYRQWFIEELDETWEEVYLGDLVEVKYGKDHKNIPDGKFPVYGSGGFMRSVEQPLYEGESVLIPRKGSLNNVMYVEEAFWTVDTMFYTIMKENHLAKFIYQFIKQKDLASMNVGSAVPSMTTTVLNNMPLARPPKEKLKSYDEIVSSFYDKVKFNQTQISTLTETRDTLLPKLMSGEAKVAH